MYADPSGRGGVLEPEGIVEIKFRTPDLLAAMHRLDPGIAAIKAAGGSGPEAEAALRAREAALLPVYRQVRCACCAESAFVRAVAAPLPVCTACAAPGVLSLFALLRRAAAAVPPGDAPAVLLRSVTVPPLQPESPAVRALQRCGPCLLRVPCLVAALLCRK
jgi:hypothetical protein